MNVFVLNTGRCGSMTWTRACSHITNFTSGHETRAGLVGHQRLAYPDGHIEVDNRLSWLLGRLDARYGTSAFYVHLRRDPAATARSFTRRMDFGIMKAYREGILIEPAQTLAPADFAADYVETVDSNIALFLRDKPNLMVADLASAARDFTHFWDWIGACGDREAALAEFDTCYNASTPG